MDFLFVGFRTRQSKVRVVLCMRCVAAVPLCLLGKRRILEILALVVKLRLVHLEVFGIVFLRRHFIFLILENVVGEGHFFVFTEPTTVFELFFPVCVGHSGTRCGNPSMDSFLDSETTHGFLFSSRSEPVYFFRNAYFRHLVWFEAKRRLVLDSSNVFHCQRVEMIEMGLVEWRLHGGLKLTGSGESETWGFELAVAP